MKVYITDVGPRDGFQIEPAPVSTAIKVETINRLAEAGVPSIESTSFVHPRYVPQMADAEEVMATIRRQDSTQYAVLVPNLRGAERALKTRPDQLNLVVSASESHNRANLKRSTFETLAGFQPVVELAQKHGVRVIGGIATSFGCPFEGGVPAERVLDVIARYLSLGVSGVVMADTTGMANPQQVRRLVSTVRERHPDLEIHLHFHNTRGMGLANVYAAYLEGVNHFDASIGGIGGCPFAPGATGNIDTVDTVHMFHEMGVETGIDLDALIVLAQDLQTELGHDLPSQVMRAGKTSDLHPLPADI
ncbi:hydroxymethylglutaryl-CoA lyase [Sulfobacillus harzensis]|uniref:Hydroxymethylglutaryl-CoA lyase n=1 Tax=Sulfobacillus harzensis TaxID=2729629 RepID=A0A7Y0L5G2_9FIRM|nr:hydroxymethylglutaryl-CoA lyase [Sulfobacillus harzensis]NMP23654.1 hydroxymethylglutaryl-CoA lyase [Sulfobacillus harzensis]